MVQANAFALVRSLLPTQRTSLDRAVADRVGSGVGSTPITFEQMTAYGVIDSSRLTFRRPRALGRAMRFILERHESSGTTACPRLHPKLWRVIKHVVAFVIVARRVKILSMIDKFLLNHLRIRELRDFESKKVL